MAEVHKQRWLLSGILVVLLSLSVLLIGSRRADAAPAYGPLITTALKYEGQSGGECYLFMQKVVREVTGRLVNGDYRQSYIDAGAVEVPLAQAQSGDIIQLVDDKNTAATASYPGLHTAFVMDNLGGGKFKVIDSNYLFDGVVRVHDDYAPLVSAARYSGISVHVYRIPLGKVTPNATPTSGSKGKPSSATVSPTATPLAEETPEARIESLTPGSIAVIAADGDCLRIRDKAGLAGKEVACPPTGAQVRVLEGIEDLDGYRWQLVASGSIVGWAADMYLDPASDTVTASSVVARPEITSGDPPPPEGGFALFVFGGGSYQELLAASGCGPETAVFWATSADGQFVWYLPAVTVAAVNAAWEGVFESQIPPGTALMGRCI